MKAIALLFAVSFLAACEQRGENYWYDYVKEKHGGKSCEYLAGVLVSELDDQYKGDADYIVRIMIEQNCITDGETP